MGMVRYFFILDDGRRINDNTGTFLADDNAAREHASRIIAELTADVSFERYRGEIIIMRDDREISRIPFQSE
jgi:hypothetical protein